MCSAGKPTVNCPRARSARLKGPILQPMGKSMAVSNRNRKALDKVLAFGSPRRRYPPKTESLEFWPIRLNGWEYAPRTEGRFSWQKEEIMAASESKIMAEAMKRLTPEERFNLPKNLSTHKKLTAAQKGAFEKLKGIKAQLEKEHGAMTPIRFQGSRSRGPEDRRGPRGEESARVGSEQVGIAFRIGRRRQRSFLRRSAGRIFF
jgi:hypothetical protein